MANRADIIFADGSHVRDVLDDLLGRPSGGILQPMGVNSDKFTHQPKLKEQTDFKRYPDGFILFFGRLVEKKGVVYLIRAMRELQKQLPDVGLVIAGYGPDEEQLKAETDRLGLKNSISFIGKQTHAEIVRLLLHECRARCGSFDH